MRQTIKYTRVAITLHWLIALLMVTGIVLGLLGGYIQGSATRPLIDAHKSVGLTIFGLAILRLLWRAAHPPPPMPVSYPPIERLSAHLVHWGLYALLFLLPISGYLHDSAFKFAAQHPLRLYWMVPVPRLAIIATMPPATKEAFHDRMFGIHVWLGYAFYAAFALHIIGALKHQILDRQPELQRMLP